VVLVVTSVPAAAWAIPALVPPTQEESADETGAGEVIADGRARLPRGEIVWTIRQIDVPGGEGLAVAEFPLGFALVDMGTVALSAENDEEPTELATGEAAFLPDRKAGTLASVGADAASLFEIALVSRRDAEAATDAEAGEEAGVVVGEPFAAPAGAAPVAATPESGEQEAATFDIELVSNTLSGQDEATIPVSGSGAPVLYLTTDGTVQLQAGEQVVDLEAGQFALLAGEVRVRAATDAPATFVVAAIGEEAETRERGEREERGERQREPRERAGGGGGGGRQGNASAGGQGQSDRAARRAARQAAKQAQGGGGGRGGQSQQQGTGSTGGAGGVDATATVPAPGGTPGAEPTLPVPTVPADGTPPPVETPPVETPPVETPPVDETAVPTATIPAGEAPTPAPTVPVVPTNPPVPEVPEVPGLPTVPAEETVVTEAAPEETLPVEEAPAAPVEEPTTEPVPEG
jgi:hypothetical protein